MLPCTHYHVVVGWQMNLYICHLQDMSIIGEWEGAYTCINVPSHRLAVCCKIDLAQIVVNCKEQ